MLARIDHDVEADDFHAKRLPSSSRTPDDRSWICNALCFKKRRTTIAACERYLSSSSARPRLAPQSPKVSRRLARGADEGGKEELENGGDACKTW